MEKKTKTGSALFDDYFQVGYSCGYRFWRIDYHIFGQIYPLVNSSEERAISSAKRFTDPSVKTWMQPGASATTDIFL